MELPTGAFVQCLISVTAPCREKIENLNPQPLKPKTRTLSPLPSDKHSTGRGVNYYDELTFGDLFKRFRLGSSLALEALGKPLFNSLPEGSAHLANFNLRLKGSSSELGVQTWALGHILGS